VTPSSDDLANLPRTLSTPAHAAALTSIKVNIAPTAKVRAAFRCRRATTKPRTAVPIPKATSAERDRVISSDNPITMYAPADRRNTANCPELTQPIRSGVPCRSRSTAPINASAASASASGVTISIQPAK
jgi:hypothetical protein